MDDIRKTQNEWKKNFERASNEAKDFQFKMQLFQAFYPAATVFMAFAGVVLALTYHRIIKLERQVAQLVRELRERTPA